MSTSWSGALSGAGRASVLARAVVSGIALIGLACVVVRVAELADRANCVDHVVYGNSDTGVVVPGTWVPRAGGRNSGTASSSGVGDWVAESGSWLGVGRTEDSTVFNDERCL